MHSKRIIPLFAAVILLVTGCAPRLERYSTSFLDVFDTASAIVAYTPDEETFKNQSAACKELLGEYHQLYDIYKEYDVANLKTINENAGIAPVQVDERIIDMLEFGIEMYKLSEGRVNICFGSVLEVWHDYRDDGLKDPDNAELPPMELLIEAAEHTDINDLIIDREAGTIYLADPEMSLDVGAIAKGYAVGEMTEQMRAKGVENAAYSIGGNVSTVGWKEGREGNYWNIGLENPDLTAGDYLMLLKLSEASLVTSGDYQRYYTVDGKKYHHIIDPATLMPAEYHSAVSVVCDRSGYADALSTMLFLMPLEEGLAFVEGQENVEAIWIQKDGSMTMSSGFASYINE